MRSRLPHPGGLVLAPGLLSLLASLLSAPPAGAAVRFQFTGDEAIVTGLTPGGEAVVAAALLEKVVFVARQSRLAARLVDDDADGEVVFELGAPAPTSSVWLAVDLATGAPALGFPGAGSFLPATLAGGESVDFRISPTVVYFGRPQAEIVVVRPGGAGVAGAWARRVVDGSPEDVNPEPGLVALWVGSLQPADEQTAAAPEALRDGDVILRVEPNTLLHHLFVADF
jgi:hypothetical protein